MRIAKSLVRELLSTARLAQMSIEMQRVKQKRKKGTPLLFNLDLHISVIADLKSGLKSNDANLISWSISSANRYNRRIFRVQDPVYPFNGKNWTNLDDDLIEKFSNHYKPFLSKIDGFITCYPPSFAALFRNFEKPNLVLSATRYEAPYTSQPKKWGVLNHYLISENSAGRMLLVGNNQGDCDYMEHYLGIKPRCVPSVCEYTNFHFNSEGSKNLVLARDPILTKHVREVTRGNWVPFREVMGQNYSWRDFKEVKEVFVVPYNISTMTLFEMATAGLPVAIPSRSFMQQLRNDYAGVLSELSFLQVNGGKVESQHINSPNDYNSPTFYDWWLDRSDFYNLSLMPNVRLVDSLKDLEQPSVRYQFANQTSYNEMINSRNDQVVLRRDNLLADFLGSL